MARRRQPAMKTPRFPHYKKRAASNIKAERLINRTIFQLTDEQIRRVHGNTQERQQFIEDVEYGIQRTRPTKQFLEENPNIIILMGKEAAQDSK